MPFAVRRFLLTVASLLDSRMGAAPWRPVGLASTT